MEVSSSCSCVLFFAVDIGMILPAHPISSPNRLRCLVSGFRETVHMGHTQNTETLGTALAGAQAEIHGPQLEVNFYGVALSRALGELTVMAVKNGLILQPEIVFGLHKAVWLGRHEISQRLDGRRFCAIFCHNAGVGREVSHLPDSIAHIAVIRVTLAGHIRVRHFSL